MSDAVESLYNTPGDRTFYPKSVHPAAKLVINYKRFRGILPVSLMSLIKLALEGDYQGIINLLELDPTKKAETDELGHSAMFCAVIAKQCEICRLFISYGFDVNEQSEEFGFTLLHKACLAGSLDICKLLVENGADITVRDPKESDALYNAITGAGSLEMCQYLISKGASCDGALHLSCFNGKVDVASWLLDEIAQGTGRDSIGTEGVNSKGYRANTPLHLACQRGFYEVCKMLIQRGANVSARNEAGCTPLHEAVLAPDSARITALLIKHGADLNAKDNEDRTPLHKASSMGHIEHCKALLDIGADINALDQSKCRPEKNNLSPLKGSIGIGDSALHYAIVAGNIEMCTFLLDRGIDLNIKSSLGKPIVHFACHHKKYKICGLLIDRGAKIDALDYKHMQIQQNPSSTPVKVIKNPLIKKQPQTASHVISLTYSETALQSAARSGNSEACVLLISKGAEVNAADEIFGNTALHLAAQDGYLEVCSVLIQNNADIHLHNQFFDSESPHNLEDTALHLAARQGHWDVCELLVQSGADLKAKNRVGQDALAVVEKSIKHALVQLWRRKMLVTNRSVEGLDELASGPTTPAALSHSAAYSSVDLAQSTPTDGVNSADDSDASDMKHLTLRDPMTATAAASRGSGGGLNHINATPNTPNTPNAPNTATFSPPHSPAASPFLSTPSTSMITTTTRTATTTNSVEKEVSQQQLVSTIPVFCGPERVWKQRRVRYSIRKTIFKQTIWAVEILELSSHPGAGAWLKTVPCIISPTSPCKHISLRGCAPREIEVERKGELDYRLVFTEPGENNSAFLKLSFGGDRARRNAWKAAILKHQRNGK